MVADVPGVNTPTLATGKPPGRPVNLPWTRAGHLPARSAPFSGQDGFNLLRGNGALLCTAGPSSPQLQGLSTQPGLCGGSQPGWQLQRLGQRLPARGPRGARPAGPLLRAPQQPGEFVLTPELRRGSLAGRPPGLWQLITCLAAPAQRQPSWGSPFIAPGEGRRAGGPERALASQPPK